MAILLIAAVAATACGDDSGVSVNTTTSAVTTSSVPSTTTPPGIEPIPLCDDVEVPTTDEVGNLSGFANIDERVTAASLTYTDQHPDTFAGRLIDRDHGGTFVFRFTDDPGPHEAALEALPAVIA